ncbi:MAG: hypothetical protein IJK87_00310 [Prevotella sp.]|nr:hypothetical protein [Prevotella sp.]
MKRIKKPLFIVLALTLALCLTGCGSEENLSPTVDLTFRLLDSDGNEKTAFSEGEDIVFELAINNRSNSAMYYNNQFEGGDIAWGEDFFMVYREDGEVIGMPWNTMWCLLSLQKTFLVPERFVASWQGKPGIPLSYPLCLINDGLPESKPLPKRNYYTKFKVYYNANPERQSSATMVKECELHFVVN